MNIYCLQYNIIYILLMLDDCWASIADDSPTLNKCLIGKSLVFSGKADCFLRRTQRDRFLYNLQLPQTLPMFSIRPLYTFPSAINTSHSPCTPDRGNVSCLMMKQTAFSDARRETGFYIIYNYHRLYQCFQSGPYIHSPPL